MSAKVALVDAVAAGLLWMGTCVAADGQEMSRPEAVARDFVFVGIPFGCSVEDFQAKYPAAKKMPDEGGGGKERFDTSSDEKNGAVRYVVGPVAGRTVEGTHFHECKFLFIDGAMAEFRGVDFNSQPDASLDYFKNLITALETPTEKHELEDRMQIVWRFPRVDRQFTFRLDALASASAVQGQDTRAIADLKKRQRKPVGTAH